MRGEDDVGPCLTDLCLNLLDRRGRKGRVDLVAGAAGFHDMGLSAEAARFEDLTPAIGEPAVADDHCLSLLTELPRDRLHREGAAAGNDGDRMGLVDLAQHLRDVPHHVLEVLAHVIERAVGEDDREFLEPAGVDILIECHSAVSFPSPVDVLRRPGAAGKAYLGIPGLTRSGPAAAPRTEAHWHRGSPRPVAS